MKKMVIILSMSWAHACFCAEHKITVKPRTLTPPSETITQGSLPDLIIREALRDQQSSDNADSSFCERSVLHYITSLERSRPHEFNLLKNKFDGDDDVRTIARVVVCKALIEERCRVEAEGHNNKGALEIVYGERIKRWRKCAILGTFAGAIGFMVALIVGMPSYV